ESQGESSSSVRHETPPPALSLSLPACAGPADGEHAALLTYTGTLSAFLLLLLECNLPSAQEERSLQGKNYVGLSKSSQASNSVENDMLQNLQLSSQEVLEKAQKKGRSKCPKCNSSRMFYCYTCYVPVETVPIDEIPRVKLPLKIDIIKHPNETDGKSTAVHAKLLAHEDVTVYTYPCIPEYDDHRHETVLVFPGPNSVPVKDASRYLNKSTGPGRDYAPEPSSKRAKCNPENDGREDTDVENVGENNKTRMHCLKKVVFIDSTWNQTNKIVSDERLQ
ncbi:hypothetical protein FKM82_017731, partial [Ascaphus truei]